MSRVALRIVYFLVVYLPLEDFLLKWIPVSYPTYLGLRQASDGLVLVAAGIVLATRLRSTHRVRVLGRGTEACLVSFAALALGTVVIRDGDVLTTVLNLKALLRYVLLIYVLLNVQIGRRDVYTFLRLLYVSLGIQLLVSLLQIVGGAGIDQFFFPRVQDTEVAGVRFQSTAMREAERGYISGTMTNNIAYGGFLLAGLAAFVTRYTYDRRTAVYWGGLAVFLGLAYLSGSRAVTFAVVLLVGLEHSLSGKTRAFLKAGALALLLLALLTLGTDLSPTDFHVFEVFTAEYLRVAMSQRLGILVEVVPQFVTEFRTADVLFGLTPDRAILNRFVADLGEVPAVLVGNAAVIEDVYWVALPVYYGLVGLGLFVGFYGGVSRSVYHAYREGEDRLEHRLARIALLLLVVAVPLNLIGQYFETRQFSFYLWLFVGMSLSYSSASAARNQQSS